MSTKHDKDCHLGDNHKHCPACLELSREAAGRLYKGQVVWLGFNRATIPPSWQGLRACVVGPTRGQRYKLSIAPDQPHGGEFCTLGIGSILTENPYLKKQ